ncbi:MAG: hypothetical protein K6B17_02665, partial [Treponema sp.]|nr:hypothetical protein [Treponema sp.]
SCAQACLIPISSDNFIACSLNSLLYLIFIPSLFSGIFRLYFYDNRSFGFIACSHSASGSNVSGNTIWNDTGSNTNNASSVTDGIRLQNGATKQKIPRFSKLKTDKKTRLSKL